MVKEAVSPLPGAPGASTLRAVIASRAVVLVAALAACVRSPTLSDPVRDPGLALQTDSLRLHLAATGPGPARIAIAFTYTNAGADTVYVPTCTLHLTPVLERHDGNDWVPVQRLVPPPCPPYIMVLPPGTVRLDTLGLCRPTSPTQSSCAPWLVDGIDGTYRLDLSDARRHYLPGTAGDTLPERRRLSNSFLLLAT